MDFGRAMLSRAQTEVWLRAGNATAINAQCQVMMTKPGIPTSAIWGFQQGMWSFKAETCFDFLKDTLE